MDIKTWIYRQGKLCCQFRLLVRTLFIGPFVQPEGGKGMGLRRWMGGIVILASCKYHLKYSKIWCNIQVIIYRFTYNIIKIMKLILHANN